MRLGPTRPLLSHAAKCLLAALVFAMVLPVSAGAIAPAASPANARSMEADGLSAALLFDGIAGDVGALALDDDIPGVPGTSPYSGALDLNNSDWIDVIQVTIPAGQVFTAEITMSPGEWVAGALFPPGSGSLDNDNTMPVQYSSVYSETADRLSYYSSSGGQYYLVLFPPDTESYWGDGYLGYTVTFKSNPLTGDSDVGSAMPLPASASDSLNWQSDVNDVYSIDLTEGQQVDISMTPSGDLDFDILFYGPDSPSVWADAILAQYDVGEGTDQITWLVPPGGGGTYHLEVYTDIYSGGYTLSRTLSTPDVPRVSGANRYLTSTASSKSTWVTSDAVVLATGTDPADALAASGIAGALDAPVILVPAYSKLSSLLTVYYEIARLDCTDVYIVGGNAAVDPWIESDLTVMGYNVTRLFGSNRYLTAAEVADEVFSVETTDTAFVVRGDDFADALAVSPYAFSQSIPVLLTKTSTLHSATAAFIETNNITNVVVAGGSAAVSDAVVLQLEALNGGATNVVRCSGSNRYSTAKAVADYAVDDMAWASWDFLGTATGESYPDALSGGAVCGMRDGVLLLTKSGSLRSEVSSAITAETPDTVMIFGGTAAVSSSVATSIQNLMP